LQRAGKQVQNDRKESGQGRYHAGMMT
jgi:hypothetical protein